MPRISAKKWMLLLCAGLAVALASVQVHLIGPGNGMTASLAAALVSIALAGVLVALALLTSNAKQKTATKLEDFGNFGIWQEAGLDAVVQDMNVSADSRVADYFASIDSELKQVDRLVGDAVGNLVASFKYINKLTHAQQEISLSIAQAAAGPGVGDGGPVGLLLERQAANADQIEQEVDAAVTALQFGDLVAQLLSHTIIRVEALGAALQRIDWDDAGHSGGERARRRQGIHEGICRAVLAANAGSRRKPVVQQGMQKGGIELF